MKILTLTAMHPEYTRITELLQAEPLRTQWWEDAESEHERGVWYSMVVVDDMLAAWAGWKFEVEAGRGVLRCCNNYIRREFRDQIPDWYELAYRHRHRHVVAHLAMPAVTYLFPEPIPLHLADGWVLDTTPGSSGDSQPYDGGPVHHWQRLRWEPTSPPSRRR